MGENLEIKKEKPNLYEYLDYRQYLRDFYNYKKNENANYSLAVFARKAQFPVRNYLKRVMDGERPVSSENLPKFCLGLELDPKEALFFESLVAFNQAKNPVTQNHYFSQLQKKLVRTKVSDSKELDLEYFDVFNNWYVIPLLEILEIERNIQLDQYDFTQISKKFYLKLSPKEIKDAFLLLVKVGLVEIDTNNNLKKAFKETRFSKNFKNILIRNYHNQMMDIAKSYIMDSDLNTRSLKALSLAVSKNDLNEIQNRIDQFFKDLNHEFSNKEETKTDIIQINLQKLILTKLGGNNENQ